MEKISVVINTYNAEKHLETVLESVKDFDEIVICDMYSTDRTIEIAKKYNCKILYHENTGYAEPARNFAIHQASNGWVFVIDADETVPNDLKEFLYKITDNKEISGVYIPFKNYFIDKWIRAAYPDYKLRFFRKEGAFWPPEVHSTVKVQGKVIRIPKGQMNLASEHLANDSITTILQKNNTYSTAEVERKKHKKITWFLLLSSPLFWFVKFYFIKKGFLDGKRGFIFAALKSQYKFSCLAKVYEYQRNNK
ncbi:glycosyltransferase family 2 protein [Capnocytophaga catalasegens]|uniref:Glycosyl transferase n=1 Tax=Capnocytophaga catalasegens TaxID=1004260 RepID=A0AAV5AW37_9FLAO|nr:glycosyltransferase family 2 protein [Capnocytophaga catalasegens]GIZ14552.1 glycosyl transferase [Capnocytophaga catalasegens]GJM50754.1 glycosyl transferase [Capnocytophaga catalasegens]GJM51907.1 glycosyl transferase [Capnocytophaga catalasegens]